MTTNPQANVTSSAKPVIVLGAGGHASVLINLLKLVGRTPIALLDDNPGLLGQTRHGIEVTGGLDALSERESDQIELVNAIGSAHLPTARQAVYERFTKLGYTFATLIHPAAIIAQEVRIEQGAQIMAGCILQPGVKVQANALINTGATIDHDTTIGEHTHVAPGTTLCGDVSIGPSCHIGARATVIQGVKIGQSVVVAAGATVVQDVPDGQVIAGTPAKPMTD